MTRAEMQSLDKYNTKSSFYTRKREKEESDCTVDVVLHPVQLLPLLADHRGQVHEHCVDLGDLLLQPQHVLVSGKTRKDHLR